MQTTNRRRPARIWFALVLAILAAIPALFIVFPAPTAALLPLGVGAPEVSAWIALVGVAALALALPDLRHARVARITAALSVLVVCLSGIPFVRLRGVAADAERQLRLAFGSLSAAGATSGAREGVRSASLVVSDLFRGLGDPRIPIRISRGVRVAEVDGVPLTADIYRPDESGPLPVLVQLYGGAWQRGAPGDDSAFAERIASLGYIVVALDYRHAPAFRFPAQLDDVKRGLAWIGTNASQWNADTSRMILIGRSAGAHLAMLAAYAPNAPRIRGVISYYGPVDLIEGYRQPPSPDPLRVRQVEEAFLGGTPGNAADQYRAASPITYVTRALPPTLLIYGGRDHIVEPRFGRTLAAALRQQGSRVVHVEIPSSEHAFDAIAFGPGGQLAQYVTERFLAAVAAPPK